MADSLALRVDSYTAIESGDCYWHMAGTDKEAAP